jgi:hypothetical protein
MDNMGDDTPAENPGPVDYWINFKNRRVRMGRGEGQAAEAVKDGFKKVTHTHFVKFIDKARNGFRVKSKKKVRK